MPSIVSHILFNSRDSKLLRWTNVEYVTSPRCLLDTTLADAKRLSGTVLIFYSSLYAVKILELKHNQTSDIYLGRIWVHPNRPEGRAAALEGTFSNHYL